VPRSVKKSTRHSKRSTLCFKNSKRVDKSLSTVILHSPHHPLIIVLTISIILTQTPKNTISTHYITYTGARNTQHFIPSLYDSTLFPLHVQIVIPLISSAFLIVNIVFFLNSPLPPYSLTSIAFQNCKQ
jgi:hypothetical protein